LSSAAQRLEPAQQSAGSARKLASSSVHAAAASAVAAIVLKRRKPEVAPSADEADADEVTPAGQRRDGADLTGVTGELGGYAHAGGSAT
jgi:hypothetical protein